MWCKWFVLCNCCNLSGGVALIVWFTTNGMCVKNNTIICVVRASNSTRDCEHDLYCCLLPRCEALRACRSGFPIATQQRSVSFFRCCCYRNWYAVALKVRSTPPIPPLFFLIPSRLHDFGLSGFHLNSFVLSSDVKEFERFRKVILPAAFLLIHPIKNWTTGTEDCSIRPRLTLRKKSSNFHFVSQKRDSSATHRLNSLRNRWLR